MVSSSLPIQPRDSLSVNRTPVSRTFVNQISRWFALQMQAQSAACDSKGLASEFLDPVAATEAIQSLLRQVFHCFLKPIGLARGFDFNWAGCPEPPETLRSLLNHYNFLLLPAVQQMPIPERNIDLNCPSGLARKVNRDRAESSNILTPDILGLLLETLLAEVSTTKDVTLRKQTGSFYTPPDITLEMIDGALAVTLGQKLDPLTGESRLSDWLRSPLDPSMNQPFTGTEVVQLVAAIAQCKILDPACGAGAFVVSMLQRLTQLLRALDPDNIEWKIQQQKIQQQKIQQQKIQQQERIDGISDPIQQQQAEEMCDRIFSDYSPDFARQFYLLHHCLHGTDILAIAVEVTQMRCALSLLGTLQENGLAAGVGQKVEDGQEVEVEALRQIWDGMGWGDRLQAINSLLEQPTNHSPEPSTSHLLKQPLLQQPARAITCNDFDVVITNPPHLDSETMIRTQPQLRAVYAAAFTTAQGNWDLSGVFVERGLQLLKRGGVLSYLVPNKLISAAYAQPLRDLLNQHRMIEICDYSTSPVFPDASAYPVSILLQKQGNSENRAVVFRSSSCGTVQRVSSPLRDRHWDRYFLPQALLEILEKCAQLRSLQALPVQVLGAATVGEAYRLKDLIQVADFSHPPLGKPYRKMINTGTLDAYQSAWTTTPMRYLGDRYPQPIVLDEALEQWNPSRLQQARAAKLIVGGLGKRLECMYDEGKYLAGKSTFIILGEPDLLKRLLAILNSRLISFWYRTSYRSLCMAGGYFRIGKTEIKSIPVPSSLVSSTGEVLYPQTHLQSERQWQEILTQVEQLLVMPERASQLMPAIDDRVEEIYGLTIAEKKVLDDYLGSD